MRRDNTFKDALIKSIETISEYRERLSMLAFNRYSYDGLPDTVDEEFIEKNLTAGIPLAFFMDSVLGLLALPFVTLTLNVYNKPDKIRVYSSNGYGKELNPGEYVIIRPAKNSDFNAIQQIEKTAKLLAFIDRIIEINVRAQKTPVVVECPENQLLTMKNFYQQYEGDMPVIFTNNKLLNQNGVHAFSTSAPYVAENLYTLKLHYWNECMTILGIPSISVDKKAQKVKDEISQENGGTLAFSNSQLISRKKAIEKVNDMFETDITVESIYDNDSSGEAVETIVTENEVDINE